MTPVPRYPPDLRKAEKALRYGREHRRTRRLLKPLVATGTVLCARCRKPIAAGAKWDLGHPDGDSAGGPEHQACNRATYGRAVGRVSRLW